jgi:hypothetical protein
VIALCHELLFFAYFVDVFFQWNCSFRAVMNMGQGMDAQSAAGEAIKNIANFYPEFSGAIVVADRHGGYGTYPNLMSDNFENKRDLI